MRQFAQPTYYSAGVVGVANNLTMSGGSFNYLCYVDSENVNSRVQDLGRMRDRLVELGYKDAARETEELILILNQIEVRVDARISRLSSVWRSVEWLDSGDSGEEGVQSAIDEYREDAIATPQH